MLMEGMNQDPIDIEKGMESPYCLLTSISDKLDRVSPLSSDCCIYKVPRQIRCLCEKAYTPQAVSIGPLHHGNEGLQDMENHKIRYLGDFLDRTKVSLEEYLKKIKNQETRLRNCYAETIEFKSDDFVRLILVDTVFIVEFFLRFSRLEKDGNESMLKLLRTHDFIPDLWLLENQLPFFIIEDIFESVVKTKVSSNATSADETQSSIRYLACRFFMATLGFGEDQVDWEKLLSCKVNHFVDLVRHLYVPRLKQNLPTQFGTIITIPSMTDLYWAGVEFKVGHIPNMFNIEFSDGILKFPCKIHINAKTDLTFRNLIAFERCHCTELYINDYLNLFYNLAKTPEDLELLVQFGILENCLRDKHQGSTLVSQLGDGVVVRSFDSYFGSLGKDLNDYCRKKKRLASWRKYFYNKRWETFSISAVLVLVLTVIQTVCSVISAMAQPPRSRSL